MRDAIYFHFTLILGLIAFSVIPSSVSIPFILLHGIGDSCKSRALNTFVRDLSNMTQNQGSCLEIGNGFLDSWFKPIGQQTEIACNKVKQMKELQKGYNIIALSQGGLIGRGVVQFCDGGPPVKNFIALGGPHAGIASMPKCGNFAICESVAKVIEKGSIYSKGVQEHLGPSNYFKLPFEIKEYLEKCSFLPKLNNEIPGSRNATYKQRFTSLQNLVLIMFANDTVIIPRESSWFGFYPDGVTNKVVPAQQTKLYTEDWIGLKTLDKAGKVKYLTVPGEHVNVNTDACKKIVASYVTG